MTDKVRMTIYTNIANRIRNGRNLVLDAFLKIALLYVFVVPAIGQQSQVLANDARALVTRVQLSPGESFIMPDDQTGSIWVSLDPLVLVTRKDGRQNKRNVLAGNTGTIIAGETLTFEIEIGLHAQLIIVKPKMPQQDLTVGPFLQSNSLEDASGRNATLLIAISSSQFQDIRNLGDESEWKPGKPDIVTMRSGSVRWIRSGIHHFKNLGPNPAKLVAIEW